MRSSLRHFFLLFLKLILLWMFLSPFLERAMALDELFHFYDSPQGLAMGNALIADAMGYAANYYNPAGLAKPTTERWTLTPIDFEGIFSASGLGRLLDAKSVGINNLAPTMLSHPGKYNYFRATVIPSATRRGLGISLLASDYYAAQSDGTNIDINAGEDIAPTFGGAISLWGGRVKLGLSLKAVLRNQLKGIYDSSVFASSDSVKSSMREGLGFGGDVGAIFALPIRYLPSLGIVCHDLGNTKFHAMHVLNGSSSGTPDAIPQSFDAAFSVHPAVVRGWRSTLAFSVDHIERHDVIFRKRSHVGIEIQNERNLYFWLGLNQLYFTAGMGLRARGGALEIGTYSEDIGSGAELREDRRYLLRYSIDF